ncbi:MAG: hypothetical protein BJ554DRAFT_1414, partial [Olpidium bornovanus]
ISSRAVPRQPEVHSAAARRGPARAARRVPRGQPGSRLRPGESPPGVLPGPQVREDLRPPDSPGPLRGGDGRSRELPVGAPVAGAGRPADRRAGGAGGAVHRQRREGRGEHLVFRRRRPAGRRGPEPRERRPPVRLGGRPAPLDEGQRALRLRLWRPVQPVPEAPARHLRRPSREILAGGWEPGSTENRQQADRLRRKGGSPDHFRRMLPQEQAVRDGVDDGFRILLERRRVARVHTPHPQGGDPFDGGGRRRPRFLAVVGGGGLQDPGVERRVPADVGGRHRRAEDRALHALRGDVRREAAAQRPELRAEGHVQPAEPHAAALAGFDGERRGQRKSREPPRAGRSGPGSGAAAGRRRARPDRRAGLRGLHDLGGPRPRGRQAGHPLRALQRQGLPDLGHGRAPFAAVDTHRRRRRHGQGLGRAAGS